MNVSETFEKVPAAEFARRHGWRESAVVHRIRAGIYDGVREDGVWYVLRAAPPESVRTPAGFDYTAPPFRTLPWPTTPGRRRWVSVTTWVGLAAALGPLVLGEVERLLAVGAAGIVLTSAPLLYEGLVSGTMRGHRGPDVAFADQPIGYISQGVGYLVFTSAGLFLLLDTLLG